MTQGKLSNLVILALEKKFEEDPSIPAYSVGDIMTLVNQYFKKNASDQGIRNAINILEADGKIHNVDKQNNTKLWATNKMLDAQTEPASKEEIPTDSDVIQTLLGIVTRLVEQNNVMAHQMDVIVNAIGEAHANSITMREEDIKREQKMMARIDASMEAYAKDTVKGLVKGVMEMRDGIFIRLQQKDSAHLDKMSLVVDILDSLRKGINTQSHETERLIIAVADTTDKEMASYKQGFTEGNKAGFKAYHELGRELESNDTSDVKIPKMISRSV